MKRFFGKEWIEWVKHFGSYPGHPGAPNDKRLVEMLFQSPVPKRLPLDPLPDLTNKVVLDIGCGLGEETRAYADRDPRIVVGLDASWERAAIAQQLAQHSLKMAVILADARNLPIVSDCIDCLVSTDTWEHLADPEKSLREACRILRPGGIFKLNFLPYYSPWGAHLWLWIPVPWIQLLIPRAWLFKLAMLVERWRRINETLPESVRQPWEKECDWSHAKGLTIRKFISYLSRAGFTTYHIDVRPILTSSASSLSGVLRLLSRLPLLTEILAGQVFVETNFYRGD